MNNTLHRKRLIHKESSNVYLDTEIEKNNKSFLMSNSIDFCTLIMSKTNLQKSIIDATISLRLFFDRNHIHNYNIQAKGRQNKKTIQATIIDNKKDDFIIYSSISLYRPETKNGDPRLWVLSNRKSSFKFNDIARENDQIAIIYSHEKKIYILNISDYDYLNAKDSKITSFIKSLRKENVKALEEILNTLRRYKDKKLRSERKGDTAVGLAIEDILGIKQNSKQDPDYKGLEIKSFRVDKKERHATRNTLFAKVADFKDELSLIKSTKEFVEKYGYPVQNHNKIAAGACGNELHCTVSTLRPNTQNIFLKLIDKKEKIGLAVIDARNNQIQLFWNYKTLREKLLSKHNDTLWIGLERDYDSDGEFFIIKTIKHTKAPNISQFFELINQGNITVDFLISLKQNKDPKKPWSTVEKGPLFKIKPEFLEFLFAKEEIFTI